MRILSITSHPAIQLVSARTIAFTAAIYENIYADLRMKGFDDFVPKPFKPEVLYTKIRDLTGYRNLAPSR